MRLFWGAYNRTHSLAIGNLKKTYLGKHRLLNLGIAMAIAMPMFDWLIQRLALQTSAIAIAHNYNANV